MKKFLAAILVLVLALGSVSVFAANKPVNVGATANPHGIILDFIKEDLAKLGFDLKVTLFTEYPLPNPATAAGDLDANYFQHLPYLNAYNKSVSEKEQLIPVIAVHYEPFGIYAGTKKDLAELKEGDSIAVPNDPSNETRALLLLQEAGLIKLPADANSESALTKLDIAENPKKLEIVEVNAELLPSTLKDVAYAVINGNYAVEAGLSPAKDALQLEKSDGASGKTYTNYVVVKKSDEKADFVIALEKVLHTDKVKDFILNNPEFKGGVVPAF